MARVTGFGPVTKWLTATYSTAELHANLIEMARMTGLEPVLCFHWPVNSRLLYH